MRIETIVEAFDILEELESLTSSLEKKDVLMQWGDNPVLMTIFKLALGQSNFYIKTNINPINCQKSLKVGRAWVLFLRLCKRLQERRLTGNKARYKLHTLLQNMDPLMAKWCSRIIDQNLRIGVSNRTINAVYGKSFLTDGQPEIGFSFNGAMLGQTLEKLPKNQQKIQFPIAAELKLDGIRALIFAFPATEKVVILSRSGKRQVHLESVQAFKEQLLDLATQLSENEPVFLDGEFVDRSNSWNKITSIIRSDKNFSEEDFLHQVRVVIFDWAPLSKYEAGIFDVEWQWRKHTLLATLDDKNLTSSTINPKIYRFGPQVGILGHHVSKNEAALQRFYNWSIDKGYEGLMLKPCDGAYRAANYRGPLCIKLKPEDELSGIIVGLRPGQGQNGPASELLKQKALKTMRRFGKVIDDGYYFKVKPENPTEKVVDLLRKLTGDGSARRVHLADSGELTYRYSARLGYLIVKKDEKTFRVGGGFKQAGGNDERMKFWQNRECMKGKVVDFKVQSDRSQVAVARFNRFVRLREDL